MLKGRRHYMAVDLSEELEPCLRDMVQGLERLLFIHRRYRWWTS